MAIKSRVIDLGEGQNKTEYLYAECIVESGNVISTRWEEESDRHREVTFAKGAPNERQLLEVDDSLADDFADHSEWLQVDQSGTDPDFVYDVSELGTSRDDWYMEELRAERDQLMAACDWEVRRHKDQTDDGVATSLTAQQFDDLIDYRQALRDWPSTEGDIYDRTAPVRA